MTEHIGMPGMIASGMRVARAVAVLTASLALTACPADILDDLVDPPPACERHDTADVSFTNTAGGAASLYVEMNNTDITGTIADGATRLTTVPSGYPFFVFRNSATGAAACGLIQQNLVQCAAYSFSCAG
jgi:hypothetical protein